MVNGTDQLSFFEAADDLVVGAEGLAGDDADVLGRAARAAAEHARAEENLAGAVVRAREAGHSWRTIGKAAGLPYQTLHRRYSGSAPDVTGAS